KTTLAPIFHDLAERIARRSLLVIISDLLDDTSGILMGLKHLRHKGHEVLVFHILDTAELDFPFQEPTLFRGMEEFPDLITDPRALRESYLGEVQSFVTELRLGCRAQNIDYVQLRTNTDLGVALSAYLAERETRSK